MKKIGICMIAMVFAGASVMANDVVKTKKAKPAATCQNCKKDKGVKKTACATKGKCCK